MVNAATVYVGTWMTSLLAAAAVFAAQPRVHAIAQRGYFRRLLRGWRGVTFVVAATGLVAIAPYTGDPTWDWVDALVMSILTYVTAPWVVGTMYLGLRRQAGTRALFVAANAWLLSASWSYDGYIFLRDGYYPRSWLFNMLASSVLYASAGLFWNLEYEPGRGIVFGFMNERWPDGPSDGTFLRVLPVAGLFMMLVTAMIGYFVWMYFR